ncbi:hypothetical protein DM860_007127 [Cuscuta australis]|uniref:DEK-C domain-containing protein n=1 Tax=Cuscuta australis TaxID=267555 RepID=A0A328E610_9ASTE|nr:hypothetical protein DM860_007127 [Cuscuta australis]
MDLETKTRISETVVEILKSSNMDEMTEFMVRESASKKLGIDLSDPIKKMFVRQVVNSYLENQPEEEANQEGGEEEDAGREEQSEEKKPQSGADGSDKGHGADGSDEEYVVVRSGKPAGAGGSGKVYSDDGLIICQLTKKRRVTITDFKGKSLVSIREYYWKDGKELPTTKGISLTAEQWACFKKNIPAIEEAIKKMESRLD